MRMMKIKKMRGIQFKKKIHKINLSGNPVVESNPNYRKELFEMIPSLESVDGIDKTGEKVESTIYGGEEDDEDKENEGDSV